MIHCTSFVYSELFRNSIYCNLPNTQKLKRFSVFSFLFFEKKRDFQLKLLYFKNSATKALSVNLLSYIKLSISKVPDG